MIKAGFVSNIPKWHWIRQFPQPAPVWDDVLFQFGGDLESCDVVFVFDGIPEELSGRLNPRLAVFVASEPANVKSYLSGFLSQFDSVLTTDRATRHPQTAFGQVGLPWHVGAWSNSGALLDKPLGFADFETFHPPKTKLVSVVASNKAFTPEHRERLDFVRKLKDYFGDEVDVFGRNINGFGDKTEVLSDYRYHIALENCSYADYWTEKLADPFLTLTYPIYHGCPNIEQYFSSGALTQIDIYDFDSAIRSIKTVIESDLAETAQPALVAARRRVLYDHNLFAILAKMARQLKDEGKSRSPSAAGIRWEKDFDPNRGRLSKRIRQKTRKLVRWVTGG